MSPHRHAEVFGLSEVSDAQLNEAVVALKAHAELPLDTHDEHFLRWYIKLLINHPEMKNIITLPDSRESFDLQELRRFFRDQLAWWAALEHRDEQPIAETK